MSDKTLTLEIVTPQRKILSEKVTAFVVPAVQGSMGVLYNHAPIIAELDMGEIKYKVDGKYEIISLCSPGFLELSDNKATIIAHTAELACDIDLERAKAARERALRRLKGKDKEIDMLRAELALKRAIIRIKAKEHQ
jgi:F-type H+-transporting ATPase subunit epsilon